MNKTDAKHIADIITNEGLFEMFETTRKTITDWTVPSVVNKGMSKGVAWNILASEFDVNIEHSHMSKVNMIREFGEFLPTYLTPMKKLKPIIKNFIHQEPKFK